MKKIMLVSVLLLAACGQKEPSGYTAPAVSAVASDALPAANIGLDGNYVSNKSKTSFAFKPDGSVSHLEAGVFVEKMAYKIEENRLFIRGVPYSLTIRPDGKLDAGAANEIFIKK